MRVDLHLHTTASDGVHPPREVLRRAAANGAALVAITDHDAITRPEPGGCSGLPHQPTVIAGVELGVDAGEAGELHLLSYFPAGRFESLRNELERLRRDRLARGERTVAKLAELGVQLAWDQVLEIADGASVGRPHIARALVGAGRADSVQDAFDRWLRDDGPAYVPRAILPLHEAVERIRECGGLASLAHPNRCSDPERAVRLAAAAGVDAIEACYARDSAEEAARSAMLAAEYGLLVTAGTDFHGLHPGEPEPGSLCAPDDALEPFLDLVRERSAQ